MTKKKNVLVSSFVTVIAVGTLSVSVTNANFNPSDGKHASVQETIKNNNIKAFKNLDNYSTVDQAQIQKNLKAIVLAHELKEESKYKEAREVLQRAGIEHLGYINSGPKMDIRDAIVNSDWQEFQEVTEGKKIAQIINTQEKFDLLVEMHELRREKRINEANEIVDKLGIRGYKI
jgi:hypothetical protein